MYGISFMHFSMLTPKHFGLLCPGTLARILGGQSQCDLFVICGAPAGAAISPEPPPPPPQRRVVRFVTLSVWHKLGADSSWEEFSKGSTALSSEVVAFAPDVAIGVDWSGCEVFRALRLAGACARVPLVYMNFRVHTESTGNTPEERDFFMQKERAAMHLAQSVVALCSSDAKSLRLLGDDACPQTTVLSPPLREEVRNLALCFDDVSMADKQEGSVYRLATQWWERSSCTVAEEKLNVDDGGIDKNYLSPRSSPRKLKSIPTRAPFTYSEDDSLMPRRRYLTCCSRLCAEKNVMRFVEIAERLASFLKRSGIVPLLVGAPTDPTYAHQVKTRLKHAFPGDLSIISDFVPPKQLAGMFRRTLLNVHPALYEAYGMTIAEAAAFGAPTLMDGGGAIGAGDLLPAPRHAIVTDMRDLAAASVVARSVLRPGRGRALIRMVGELARHKALAWDERAVAASLRSTLDDVMRHAFRASDAKSEALGTMPSSHCAPATRCKETGFEFESEDDLWPWLPMVEWAGEQCEDGVVLRYDIAAVRTIVSGLACQPPVEPVSFFNKLSLRTPRENTLSSRSFRRVVSA